eukprot:gnl/Chilomastix_cuspidata/979.p2 GENE.gnl/Chilomastix_cuspidata/979~~gnl/Chilomastix_cuspidata/979.p2  ORF type:complete len:127 (+),score=7.38 gnl/Chilomastix_cuspidata/979:262-642(+)
MVEVSVGFRRANHSARHITVCPRGIWRRFFAVFLAGISAAPLTALPAEIAPPLEVDVPEFHEHQPDRVVSGEELGARDELQTPHAPDASVGVCAPHNQEAYGPRIPLPLPLPLRTDPPRRVQLKKY